MNEVLEDSVSGLSVVFDGLHLAIVVQFFRPCHLRGLGSTPQTSRAGILFLEILNVDNGVYLYTSRQIQRVSSGRDSLVDGEGTDVFGSQVFGACCAHECRLHKLGAQQD